MHAGTIERIEANVERGAAAFFAAAVAFAVFIALQNIIPAPQRGVCAAAVLFIAYLGCGRAMGAATPRDAGFHVQVFDVRDLEPSELDELLLTEQVCEELVLTDADRLQPEASAEQPLLLEDALPPAEDSRVVRLFDRRVMPTASELKSRIDNHRAGAKAPQSDASKALAEALAELRRSLR